MKLVAISSAPLLPRAPSRSCAQAVAQDAFRNTYLLDACTSADPATKLLSTLNTCHGIRVPDAAGVASWPSVYAGTELTLFAANQTSSDFVNCVQETDLHDSPAPSDHHPAQDVGIGLGVLFGLLGVGLSTWMLARWWRKGHPTCVEARPAVPPLGHDGSGAPAIEMRPMTSDAQAPAYLSRAASPVSSMFKAPVEHTTTQLGAA